MKSYSKSIAKIGLALAFGLSATNAFAVDACKDEMANARGNAHSVNGNQTGSISGTPWGFEQWSAGGSNSMKYYDNGTFEAQWNNNQDYLARVGFRYGDNGPGVDHTTKQYTVDYKYTKTGSAQYGYIGVYGWTVDPQVEYYIVDDWFSKPSESYIGAKRGEITVDGATYTIHAYLRQQEASKTGTSTFLQIFSVRQSARQCGHIDISAHFNKWDELFTGQQAQLSGSKGGGSATLKFGKVTEVMLMTEAGGGATGSVNYTYFDMSDNGEPSVIEPPKDIARQPFKGVAGKIPGTIEGEDFDEGNDNDSYGGASGDGDADRTDYRGEDSKHYSVTVVKSGTGYAVGYTSADQWMEYTVEVAKDGEYEIAAGVSNGSGSGTITLAMDKTKIADLSFTGADNDWDTYEEATGKATLTAGKHTLRVTLNNANTNLDYIKFTLPGYTEDPQSGDNKDPQSGDNKDPQSGDTGVDNPENPQAISMNMNMASASKTYQVFDMQGKFMGRVDVMAGHSVAQAVSAKFHKSGVFMVKQGSFAQRIAVK